MKSFMQVWSKKEKKSKAGTKYEVINESLTKGGN